MDSASNILKISSILFIVFGVIAAIISLIAVVGSGVVTAYAGVFGGALLFVSIIALLSSALEIIIGFLGLKKCNDPSQANYFIVTGAVLCGLGLISMISSFSITGLISFVLPGLYIYGGSMLKKA
ncbi:MAG: hypothetical protein ACOYU3_06345 [Bacillota bacterium]